MNYCQQLQCRTKMFAVVATLVVVLDQITKAVVIATLTYAAPTDAPGGFWNGFQLFWTHDKHPTRNGVHAVIENFWHFRYVENPGAAWGILSGSASWFRTPFFLLVSIAAMVFIVRYFYRTEPGQRLLRVALALVFGGAVGNFIDRARLGYVIDFIDWHWYEKATWPTFNVADAAISCGVAMLVLDMLLQKKKPAGAGA